jgi:hypothetical protein
MARLQSAGRHRRRTGRGTPPATLEQLACENAVEPGRRDAGRWSRAVSTQPLIRARAVFSVLARDGSRPQTSRIASRPGSTRARARRRPRSQPPTMRSRRSRRTRSPRGWIDTRASCLGCLSRRCSPPPPVTVRHARRRTLLKRSWTPRSVPEPRRASRSRVEMCRRRRIRRGDRVGPGAAARFVATTRLGMRQWARELSYSSRCGLYSVRTTPMVELMAA